jgi:hypothetical protein
VIRDREPGEHLGQHGQVGSQRGAHRARAGAGGHQHARGADLFLVGADRPPVMTAFQRPDLPVAQERGAVPLGQLEGREHGLLAAQVAALGVEEGDVTVADQMLRQPPPRLVRGGDLEPEASFPPGPQQGGVVGVVVRGPAAAAACNARPRRRPSGTPGTRPRRRRTAPGP